MSVAGKKLWTPDPDITPEQLESMRVEVVDRIIVARVGLLLQHPFFGNMATRLRILAADDWLPTAAVDGRNLYFNTQFFNAMSNKEIEFVIAHEILHCVFDHLGRREDRDPMLYNIAADYIVNNLLVRDKIGKKPSIVDCYQDFKYEGWQSEAVYDDLFEQAEQNGKEFLEQLGEMLDEHLDMDGEDDNGGDNGEDKDTNGNNVSKKKPKFSKEEIKKIKDELKESMLSSAQTAGAGNVPGEIQRMIKELTEPKMNWRELLRQQIQSTIKNDYTFSRPSRKGWHTGAILPGMNFMDTIDIAVAIDMSAVPIDDPVLAISPLLLDGYPYPWFRSFDRQFLRCRNCPGPRCAGNPSRHCLANPLHLLPPLLGNCPRHCLRYCPHNRNRDQLRRRNRFRRRCRWADLPRVA